MNERQKEIKELDAIWHEIIKLEFKGRCGLCGKAGAHAHHIARKKGAMRWLIPNGIYLCVSCHDHDHEDIMNQKIMGIIGLPLYLNLVSHARECKQYKTYELKELKETLKGELKRRQG